MRTMLKNILRNKIYSRELFKNVIHRDICMTSANLMQLKWQRVPFNGIQTDLQQLPDNTETREFSRLLRDSIKTWKEDGKRSMWIKVPVNRSYLVPAAFKNGFSYHHAERDYAMLFQWLPEKVECKVPEYATHHVGVSGENNFELLNGKYGRRKFASPKLFVLPKGLVLNESNGEVLVVQDKKKYKIGTTKKTFWKFPGGLSDQGENIGSTAEREVFEETGVKSEFQSLLLFRQQHEMKSTFNKSDIYAVCRMKPLTYDIILCDDEIMACQWMHLNEVISHPDTTPLTKIAAKLALNGMKYGFEHFDISASELRSWVDQTKTFLIYHRPLASIEDLNIQKDINAAS